ncbi:TPA: hypothetical protein LA460_000236 [Clostridium botulinum]|nr:hypothetical protein [Clostridium botulinum]HBJ1652840.1 hypothetical protein [Clostridium botulinum]
MAIKNMELAKLSLDTFNGVTVKFNDATGEDAIRKALVQSVGGEWSFYNFMDNRGKFFQVLTDVLALPVQKTIEGMFDGLVDFENIALGDKKVFDVENVDLFKVATIASGNLDIRRQRLYSRQIEVTTSKLGIKIYEDFDRFIAGRINWSNLIEKVRKSLSLATSEKIYECLMKNYTSASTNYCKTGTFDEKVLDQMIARVEAKTGMKCAIYGTKTALAKVSGATSINTVVGASDNLKNDYANLGYFKNYKGTAMMELPTILKVGTDEFAFNSDDLFILPIGEKLIKVVYEGDPEIYDIQDASRRNDEQIEFFFGQKMGVVCLLAGYFGIYRLQ